MIGRWILIANLTMLLSACDRNEQVFEQGVQATSQDAVSPMQRSGGEVKTSAGESERPDVDEGTLAMGRQLYLQHCGQCHGEDGEGATDWQKPDADGTYPPPPLNGTGHAWHHPMNALRQTIRLGTIRLGGNMPAWGSELSAEQIDAIILWFQSQWPDELYQAWARMDRRKGGS